VVDWRRVVVRLETQRLVLRGFASTDWPEVLELAKDGKRSPGPGSDKLPTTEAESRKFTDYLARSGNYYAMCLRADEKVIGLLALNGLDEDDRFDLGHIVLSKYQDDDHDREALAAMVELIFGTYGMFTITAHSAAVLKQTAPLRSLGFTDGNLAEGELTINKREWDKRRRIDQK
jgi:RimJ/RimL family protein N-acetyltransferase